MFLWRPIHSGEPLAEDHQPGGQAGPADQAPGQGGPPRGEQNLRRGQGLDHGPHVQGGLWAQKGGPGVGVGRFRSRRFAGTLLQPVAYAKPLRQGVYVFLPNRVVTQLFTGHQHPYCGWRPAPL